MTIFWFFFFFLKWASPPGWLLKLLPPPYCCLMVLQAVDMATCWLCSGIFAFHMLHLYLPKIIEIRTTFDGKEIRKQTWVAKMEHLMRKRSGWKAKEQEKTQKQGNTSTSKFTYSKAMNWARKTYSKIEGNMVWSCEGKVKEVGTLYGTNRWSFFSQSA